MVWAGHDEQAAIDQAQRQGTVVPVLSGADTTPGWLALALALLGLTLVGIALLWAVTFADRGFQGASTASVVALFVVAFGAVALADSPTRFVWWEPSPGTYTSLNDLWAFIGREARAAGAFLLLGAAMGTVLVLIARSRRPGLVTARV